jgi:hypothetical protein
MKGVVPERCEKDGHDYGKYLDADGFGFLEAFYKAVHESSKPQKPLEEGS